MNTAIRSIVDIIRLSWIGNPVIANDRLLDPYPPSCPCRLQLIYKCIAPSAKTSLLHQTIHKSLKERLGWKQNNASSKRHTTTSVGYLKYEWPYCHKRHSKVRWFAHPVNVLISRADHPEGVRHPPPVKYAHVELTYHGARSYPQWDSIPAKRLPWSMDPLYIGSEGFPGGWWEWPAIILYYRIAGEYIYHAGIRLSKLPWLSFRWLRIYPGIPWPSTIPPLEQCN